MYETTNNIKYQYLDVDFGNASYNFGVSATAGIRQTGSNYLQYSYNQAVIQNGMAICFTYPGSEPCDGGDVPWLGESIQAGTISANGGTLGWTNYFTATEAVGIDQPGEYFATLRMQPTTEALPVKLISVNMTVLPSQTQGLLVGNVTSDRPGGPLQADILIESSGGITWTLQTDPNGYYSYYLHTGNYSVTASTNGYIPQTTPVVIVGQQTTVQNFILSLDAPEIAVIPTTLGQSLMMGQVANQTLNISNVGNELLTFEITERNSGFTPILMGEDFLIIRHDSTAAAAMKTALTSLGYTYLEVTDAEFQVMTPNQLLNYLAVFHAGTTGTSGAPSASEILLMAYLDAGGSLFISDNDLGYWRQGSVFYNTYLQSTYNVDDGGGIVNGLNLMAGLTLDITADPYPDGITVGAEGTPILQFQGSVNQNGVAINRSNYRAIYTAFDFQNIADPAQEVEVIHRVINYLVVNDIEWLFEEPISGTIAIDNSVDINIKFDAGFVAQPGEYTADLKIRNNDPYKSQITVPVTMTVLPTTDFGKLSGTVTSLGYCDSNPTPLTEVDVQIQGADGYTQTLITDDSGYYQWWLDEVHSPLTITVTYPEHESGLATGITVTGGNTTTQDFNLRWLMPCMSVDPTTFEVSLAEGDMISVPLTITNAGAVSSGFEIIESTGALLGQSRPIETVGAPVGDKDG